jgi:hypothetical protein
MARVRLTRYPWFDLSRSIADWQSGDAAKQLRIQRRMVNAMAGHIAAGRLPFHDP